MFQPGDTVTVYMPDEGEGECFTRGEVVETVAAHPSGSHALHVVLQTRFKWNRSDSWGEYDGIPKCIARETRGNAELTWVDNWPRRGN